MVHRGPGQPQGVNQVEGGDGLVHPAVSGDEVLQVAADREPAASLGTHRHLPVQGGEKEGGGEDNYIGWPQSPMA